MPLYTTYATKEDLSDYLFIPLNELPSDSEKLLARASEIVKHATLNNLDILNEQHLEAMKMATCAQVEYWLNAGEQTDIIGNMKSYSLDDLSVDFGDGKRGALSDRAIGHLNSQGLLYRGI